MEKFAGLVTCQTFNFNGNRKAALAALASSCIGRKVCVSKNVCHRTLYDDNWHAAVGAAAASAQAVGGTRFESLNLFHFVMTSYLKRKPGGKAIHDPLALATAIDESVCTLAGVEIFSDVGGWGSRLAKGAGTHISIDFDEAK